jgi:hypothetical protein
LLYVEVKLGSVDMMSIPQKNAYEEISREVEIWKILNANVNLNFKIAKILVN